jgi:hypothetical protein
MLLPELHLCPPPAAFELHLCCVQNTASIEHKTYPQDKDNQLPHRQHALYGQRAISRGFCI